MRTTDVLLVAVVVALALACDQSTEEAVESSQVREEPIHGEAERFVAKTEVELEALARQDELAGFRSGYDQTEENARLAAEATRILSERSVALAREAARFDGMELPADVARKLSIIKLATTFPAPTDPEGAGELQKITTSIEGNYISAQNCTDQSPCRPKKELYRVVREAEDLAEKQQAWEDWHAPARAIRGSYPRMVEIANQGARDLGFEDVGALARAAYDMPPEAFREEYERLWEQVRPLYEALHCHVRARLHEVHGDAVPASGPIPAHVLGNMWAQFWTALDSQVGPEVSGQRIDVTELLKAKGYDALAMVKAGENFFRSLGFQEIPESFWEKSMFVEPVGRDVSCQASAWAIDPAGGDVRLRMCTEVSGGDFLTVHHELGHVYNYLAYSDQPFLFQDAANPGLQEGMGDAMALSITPSYLQAIGLLDEPPGEAGDLPYLFQIALEFVPKLAMAAVVDQWRWAVFAEEISPDAYNAGWWNLRRSIQGLAPPLPRTEADFDPGMFYHVSYNRSFDRYFTALFLQFDIHKALCEAAGHEGPLHLCSIYENEAAGERLRRVLALGASQPSPDTLEMLTGHRNIDASALVEYFRPVLVWLDEQNEGRVCGW